MDLQTALIVVAIVILAFASLLFVYKFSIKEKSYEEALAEQRQQTNTLLGTHARLKPKEKKTKKAAKKLKEKQASMTDPETTEDLENTESPSHKLTHQKSHVEFKEPTVVELSAELPIVPPIKKRTKKEKVRPILVNKDKSAPNLVIDDMVEVLPANHFEERHPKDEFELLHSISKEDVPKHEFVKEKIKKEEVNKQEAVKEKTNKIKSSNEVEPMKINKKMAKQQTEPSIQPVIEKEVAEQPIPVQPHTNGVVTNTGKEKKKKKSEFNTLQQLTGDKPGENLPILLNLVRKAEMTRSEVQILIDLLLNKQHEAPAVIDDWSEGKSDPVQKLKKQLAEKEKALIEEQEALAGAQAKLREIRAEQTAEKSQLQQRVRGLEETLQNKQLELQSINNRLHGQAQKIQQLQAQLNEEIINNHKIREEQAAMQLQRQQLELRVAQSQEMEAGVVQLRNEIKDLSNRNAELHALHEKNLADREHHIVQLQHQLAGYQKDLEQKNEINKKFEDVRVDLERRLDVAIRQENELNQEISRLKTAYQQQIEEVRRLGHVELVVVRLQAEVTALQEEKFKLLEDKAQLQAVHANTSVEENKAHKVEILNLHNELASMKTQLQQTEKKYTAELDASKTTVCKLQSELDEQRNKNNELRQKNWKVMEALNAVESRSKSVAKASKELGIDLNSAVVKAREEEQETNKRLLQRLFPEIKELGNVPQDQFYVKIEKLIQNYVNSIKQQEKQSKDHTQEPDVAKLRAQVLVYEKIVVETNSELNELQRYIEKEEISWRNELKAKQKEIDVLKEDQMKQLQSKLATLEEQLLLEQNEKKNLLQELQTLQTHSLNNDATITVEKLTEELNRLREQLFIEQNRNSSITQVDNNLPLKAQIHPSTNGSPLIQRTLSSSSSAASSLTEVAIKPKNKKKKKKGNGN